DDGESASTSAQVTVSEPPAGVLAQDDFTRTVQAGWGDSAVGGPWSSTGVANRFAVTDGVGQHILPAGATNWSVLESVSTTDTEVQAVISTDRMPAATTFIHVMGRVVGQQFYSGRIRLAADGSVQLHVTRGTGTPVAGGVVSGLTHNPGDQLQV